MINSHKELVSSIQNYGKKMEFIKTITYLTDINKASEVMRTMEHRGFVFGLYSMNHDKDYNTLLTYGVTIVDKVNDSVSEVVVSEEENMFCLSALHDYLNYVSEGYVEIENMQINQEGTESGVVTSASGFFTLTVKRTASYWKQLDNLDA